MNRLKRLVLTLALRTVARDRIRLRHSAYLHYRNRQPRSPS